MKHSTLALVFVVTILLASVLAVPAQAASIGIYAAGTSQIGGFLGCIVPSVDLTIRDLDQPLKAIEFSLDVSEGLGGCVNGIYVHGATVTQDGNNLTLRFDQCVQPRATYSIPLFWIWYDGESEQSICLGPASPSSVEPAAIAYETCSGQPLPMELGAATLVDIQDGCLLVSQMIGPAAESSWGTFKTWY